jgi:PKD repeat protein
MNKIKINMLIASMIIGAFSVSTMKAQQSSGPKLIRKEIVSADATFNEAKERAMMKKDGLSQPVIDKLIAERKLFVLKNKDNHGLQGQYNSLNNKKNPVVLNCSALGVESGWDQWNGAAGQTNSGNPCTFSPPTNPPPASNANTCFTLTSGAGVDPCTPGTDPVTGLPGPPIQVVAPGFGSTSIEIGCDQTPGCFAEQITYAFTPTNSDTNLVYTYAVVLYDPGTSHAVNERPFVDFVILAPNGDTVPCSFHHYTAPGGGTLPGFYLANATCTGGTSTFYKPWTTVGVNLSNYVGQNLTIRITNVDCSQCGHYAQSYWDFQCGPVPLAAGCVGNQSTITGPVSDPTNPYQYQWFHNGVIMPGQTNQTTVVTPAVGDTFSLQVLQGSGCNFYLTYVPAVVIPNFTYTGKCGSYVFTDSSYVTPTGTASITGWNWSFPGGAPATANTATASVTYPPGTYNATLTITSSAGCTATIPKPLTVGGFPTGAFTPTSPCLGTATTLVDGSLAVTGDPIASWSWSMPGGTPTTASSTTASATHNATTTYPTSGTHTVTLIVTSSQGCKDTIDQQVLVYNPPVANFSKPDSGCAPVCVGYNDLSTSTDGTINAWQWTFPGGSPGTSTSAAPTNICYNTPGTYSVSLIVTTSYGCKDTIKLPMIEVFPWPKAEFCVAPSVAPTTDPVFNFCDMWSSDVVQWSWNFGDNDSDKVNTDPIHNYSATATENDFYSYQICIRVKNVHGCWDTTCHTVELIPEFTFYIPNTFTPNGDFVNEMFYGKCRGVKEYNIWVFDRWGNQLWDCHKEDKNTNWDSDASIPKEEGLASACKWNGVVVQGGMDMGGNSRQLAQEDVYVWKVKLTDIFNKKHTYIGHVNIVK